MPETDIVEYSVIIIPPLKVKNDVELFKEIYVQNFGKAKHVNLPVHISICNFRLRASRESALQEELLRYLSGLNSFKIGVSGFFSFKSSGLIYIKPEKDEIVGLQRHITAILRNRMRVIRRQTPILNEPYIPLALCNNKMQYQRIWTQFEHMIYYSQFIISKITVLKKSSMITSSSYELAFELNLNTKTNCL